MSQKFRPLILRPWDGRENLFSSTSSQPPPLCSGTLFLVSGIPLKPTQEVGECTVTLSGAAALSLCRPNRPHRPSPKVGRRGPDAKPTPAGRRTRRPCPGGRSMGALGPLGTLRPPGVWYIACHKGMRTLFRGAAAGADGHGRGRGDGGSAHRNLASRQQSHYIRGVADTMRGGAYSIAGRRGNGAGGRTHYGTGRCRAES